jgi:hypothetical protein
VEPGRADPITEDLEKLLGKKIKGVAAEHTDMHYIYLGMSHGKRAVLSSKSPIYVEVEDEQ